MTKVKVVKTKAVPCPKGCGLSFSGPSRAVVDAALAEHDEIVHPPKPESRRGR